MYSLSVFAKMYSTSVCACAFALAVSPQPEPQAPPLALILDSWRCWCRDGTPEEVVVNVLCLVPLNESFKGRAPFQMKCARNEVQIVPMIKGKMRVDSILLLLRTCAGSLASKVCRTVASFLPPIMLQHLPVCSLAPTCNPDPCTESPCVSSVSAEESLPAATEG